MAKAFFTDDAAQRIVAATVKVEGMSRDYGAATSQYRGEGGDPIRICRTQYAWGKGTLSDLVLMEGGVAGGETDNFPEVIIKGAVNLFADVEAGKAVAIAAAGNGRWYLIAAEC
jgi:molybdopterin biosynthesis enzyme